MSYEMNEKQLAQLAEDYATTHLPAEFEHTLKLAGQFDGYRQTQLFHVRFNMPARNDWSYVPTVSERLLRGRLLIEEVLETLEAMGLELEIDGLRLSRGFETLEVVHVEGSRYDPIETADGLADIKVIANGTAVAFGIPQTAVDNEVWASNMSKLDENGNPIVNQCKHDDPNEPLPFAGVEEGSPVDRLYCAHKARGRKCSDVNHLIDPKQPIGKVLKPKTYIKANIARLYYESTTGFGD